MEAGLAADIERVIVIVEKANGYVGNVTYRCSFPTPRLPSPKHLLSIIITLSISAFHVFSAWTAFNAGVWSMTRCIAARVALNRMVIMKENYRY